MRRSKVEFMECVQRQETRQRVLHPLVFGIKRPEIAGQQRQHSGICCETEVSQMVRGLSAATISIGEQKERSTHCKTEERRDLHHRRKRSAYEEQRAGHRLRLVQVFRSESQVQDA